MNANPRSKDSHLTVFIFILAVLILSATPAGAFWTAEERLTNDASPSLTSPNNAWCVAFDAAGNINVVWTDYRDGYTGVYHKAHDGLAWNPDTMITIPTAVAYNPSVAGDGIGNIHAVWTDYRDGNSEIYYKAYDGMAWGAPERISSNSSNSFNPSVAAGDSGEVHIVWQDYRDLGWEIYYRSFDGTTWSAEQRLTNETGNSVYPSVAVGPGGTVHVAWQDYRDGNDEIYYRRFDETWGADERLTTDSGSSEHPSIAVDADGNAHVVWSDDRDGAWEIYHKVRLSGVWGGDERLTNEPVESSAPSIAADSSGGVHIAWLDLRHGNEEIYYRGHDGLVWGDEQRLSNDDDTSQYPSIAVDPDGNRVVVWQDDRDGNTEIYARRYAFGPFPPPVIASIVPSQGQIDFIVAITDLAGQGFIPGAEVWLQLAGEPDVVATGVAVETSERITCLLDLGGVTPGFWDVVVENPDGQRDTLEAAFEVTPWPEPVITSITPSRGYVGQILEDVSLEGAEFRDPATVWFEKPEQPNLTPANVTVVSSSRIEFDLDLTGVALGNWAAIVQNPDGQRDTLAAAFAVWPWPEITITSVSPSEGFPGQMIDSLHIFGDGFLSPRRVWLAKRGSAPIPTERLVVHSTTWITCRTYLSGADPGLWDVVVENHDLLLAFLEEGFTIAYLEKPEITSIYPFEAVAGERVVITDLAGDNFHADATVWLQNSEIIVAYTDSIVVVSPQKITCRINLSEALQGYLDIVVRNPDGVKDTLPSAFRVIPTIWGEDTRLTYAAGISNLSKGNARCIAADGMGNIHAAWYDERHGHSEIYYMMHDGGGWGVEERITDTVNESENPSLAINSDNTVYIFWADRMQGDWGIYYIFKDIAGWGAIQCLTDAQSLVNNPSVAIDVNNDIHVAWQSLDSLDNYQIIYARTQNSAWMPPDTLTQQPGNYRFPAIAADETGAIHVVWLKTLDDDECLEYRNSDGLSWQPAVQLFCKRGTGAPSLCADSDGKLHLAWHDKRYDSYEIFYNHYDGAAWEVPLRLCNAWAKSINPSIVSDDAGQLTVVWSDERHTDYTFEIYSRHFDGASWQPETRLTFAPGSSRFPSGALDGEGTFHVIWSDDRSGDSEIYYKIRGAEATSAFDDLPLPAGQKGLIRALPNPFRGSVEIGFSRSRAQIATVSVYDVSGRLVWSKHVEPGPNIQESVTWDGCSPDGEQVAAGVYLIKLQVGAQRASAKIVMLR